MSDYCRECRNTGRVEDNGEGTWRTYPCPSCDGLSNPAIRAAKEKGANK